MFSFQYIGSNEAPRKALKKDLPYRMLYPVRWNVGWELGGADWGQLTLKGYVLDVRQECFVREKEV